MAPPSTWQLANSKTAGAIVNQVSMEVGLGKHTDPYASTDPLIQQLCGLLNSAGRELVALNNWSWMQREWKFTTDGIKSFWELPDAWGTMTDQSAWQRSNRLPLGGPLGPQQWQYLKGLRLGSSTIYLSYRLWEGGLDFWPSPPPANIEIAMEYISNAWVWDVTTDSYKSDAYIQSDVVLHFPVLIQQLLKLRWLEAKSLPTMAASEQYGLTLSDRIGKDNSAPVVNLAWGPRLLDRYLNPLNIPWTDFGRP